MVRLKTTKMFSSAGFTMIELIVSMAIIFVLSSITYTNFPKFQRQTKTSDAAAKVLTAAQDARQKSIAVQQFGTTNTFPSYGLYLDTTSAAASRIITLYADCVADDNADKTLDDKDIFSYNPASTACGGANGFVETRTLDPRVVITQLRLIGSVTPSPTVVQKAYIEFVRPQPSVWISGTTSGGAPISALSYGRLEITIQDDQNGNTKVVNLWINGRMEVQ